MFCLFVGGINAVLAFFACAFPKATVYLFFVRQFASWSSYLQNAKAVPAYVYVCRIVSIILRQYYKIVPLPAWAAIGGLIGWDFYSAIVQRVRMVLPDGIPELVYCTEPTIILPYLLSLPHHYLNSTHCSKGVLWTQLAISAEPSVELSSSYVGGWGGHCFKTSRIFKNLTEACCLQCGHGSPMAFFTSKPVMPCVLAIFFCEFCERFLSKHQAIKYSFPYRKSSLVDQIPRKMRQHSWQFPGRNSSPRSYGP